MASDDSAFSLHEFPTEADSSVQVPGVSRGYASQEVASESNLDAWQPALPFPPAGLFVVEARDGRRLVECFAIEEALCLMRLLAHGHRAVRMDDGALMGTVSLSEYRAHALSRKRVAA